MEEVGGYSYDDYVQLVQAFHGAVAPGMVLGGIMVDAALRNRPEGEFFDAVSETSHCLPDAVQLLTPCTIGNGWLKVVRLGRFALTLFEKYRGEGVRVSVDCTALEQWPAVKEWYFKLKEKKDQDSEKLLEEIKEAGTGILRMEPVRVRSGLLGKHERGNMGVCPSCEEGYPLNHGPICRACQGESPYEAAEEESVKAPPRIRSVPLEAAIGHRALHDMTLIIPQEQKGPAFKRGQPITVGDICRLQEMGRRTLYVEDERPPDSSWVHEDEAALEFARLMAGEGVDFGENPSEGKVNFSASRGGLLVVNQERLEAFNMIPQVMCASRQSFAVVNQGRKVAGARAIPLYLPREHFQKAMAVLREGPLFEVRPMRRAKVGILVTGSEVFQGLVEDRFIPIIRHKVEKFDCEVAEALIAPDEREVIKKSVEELLEHGADLIVTTAGLSVDPDDVTRHGLRDAGARDMLYGAPILPGAMTLLARIGHVQVIGVPACGLYFKSTSFDLLLPRLLAGLKITRRDLAKLSHGAFCLECKACTYPKCPFGK